MFNFNFTVSGVALNDSPMALAAYILDRFMIFTDPSNRNLTDGGIGQIDLTGFLDNVMIYWTTGSIASSMRLYKETFANSELEQVLTRCVRENKLIMPSFPRLPARYLRLSVNTNMVSLET